MKYRRAHIPGGSFFFTLVTQQRRPLLGSAEAVDTLRAAFRHVRATRPFELDAAVILPDHLHCIWTLPADDTDYSVRWRLIKTWFTKHYDRTLRGKQRTIWQQRYWEHALRDEADFRRHVEYIHFNPVKHGHAASPMAWPYSSFRRYVEAGIYPADWGQTAMDFEDVGHE